MKRTYIIAAVMIGVAIAMLMSSSEDLSTYSTFSKARETGQKVKVVGQLSKDKEMVYNPEKDPNYFSFFIKDAAGEENRVVLLSEKPQDFELSEQIVVTGKMMDGDFIASDLLMKCPSKYKDEEITLKEIEKG